MSRQLDADLVVSCFSLFTGLDGGLLEPWRGLCGSEAAALEARIKPEVDAGAHMEALCQAAAAGAYYSYAMLRDAGSLGDEIKVGEITVKNSASTGGGRESAAGVQAHFHAAAAHLLVPECPALLSVGGRG